MTKSSRSVALATAFASAAVALAAPSAAWANEQCGKGSWYALTSRTASGEMMNPALLTAAHRTLPFGTKVRVTNRTNGRSVVVRINDRGPFVRGRIVDVSKEAARQLGMVSAGVVRVCIAQVS